MNEQHSKKTSVSNMETGFQNIKIFLTSLTE
uniref:Uncharacterized protein n=1 Tax=Anguilla anguilla TaxID=7936 RepID=A0A0E9SN97_ANGAN